MCEGTAEDFSAQPAQQARSPLSKMHQQMAFPSFGAQAPGAYSFAESGLQFEGNAAQIEQGSNSLSREEGNASSGESSARCSKDEGITSVPVRYTNGSLGLEWLQRPPSGGKDFEELGRLLSEDDWMANAAEQESGLRRMQSQQRGVFASGGGALNVGMSAEGGSRLSGGNSMSLKGDPAEEVRKGGLGNGAHSGEQVLGQPRVSRFRPPDALFLPAKRKGSNIQSFQPGTSFAPPFKGANSIPEGSEVPEDAATSAEGVSPWSSVRPTDLPRTKMPRLGAKCAEDFFPLPMQSSLQRTQSDPAQWLQNYMPGDELVEDTLSALPPPQMPPRPPPLLRHSSLPAASRGNPVPGGRLQRQKSAPQPEVMALLAEQILLELQQSEEAQKERLSVDQVQQMWDQASAPTFQGDGSSLQKQAVPEWHFGMQQDFLYPASPFVPQQQPPSIQWAPQNPPLPEAQKRPPILRAFERITVPELPPGGSPTSALPCAPNESVLVPVGPNLAKVMKIFQDSKQPAVNSSFLVGAPMQASVPNWEFNECLLDLDSPSPFVGETGRRLQ